jgi:hypothetical protein
LRQTRPEALAAAKEAVSEKEQEEKRRLMGDAELQGSAVSSGQWLIFKTKMYKAAMCYVSS